MMLTYTEIFQHSVSASQNCYNKVFIYNHGLLSHYFQNGLSSPCSMHPAFPSVPFVALMLSTLPRLPPLPSDNSYSNSDSRKPFISKDICGIPSLHLRI